MPKDPLWNVCAELGNKTRLSDSRYTIAKEFCGYPKPRWVTRFCGEWVGQGERKSDAVMLYIAHSDARQREMTEE